MYKWYAFVSFTSAHFLSHSSRGIVFFADMVVYQITKQ